MSVSVQAQPLDMAVSDLTAAQRDSLRQGEVVVNGKAGQYVGLVLAAGSTASAWAVLTDYRNFEAFLPSVVQSRVLETDGDRHVVEQIDQRQVLLASVKSRVCTENVEQPQDRIDFRLLEGDLKTLQGYWQLRWVQGAAGDRSPQVLISQTVTAEADAGLFEGAFHGIFEDSLRDNLDAIRQEVERRSPQP